VEGERVARVAPPGTGGAPALSGGFLLPGLVDTHVHGAGPRLFTCGPLHDGAPPIRPFSSVVETPEAVVAGGRRYRRETIDAAFDASVRRYRSWLYDTVSMAIGARRRNRSLVAARGE
jgi:cytosine/adenosine deaminase-related metal-dependent hydrolase